MATTDTETDELTAALERADSRYREVANRIDEVGEARVEAVADALDRARGLLDRYEGRATGSGDFKAFVEFKQSFSELVENLDEDLPRREAFEEANDVVDKRRISEGDFETARDRLDSAEPVAELLDERASARQSYREAKGALRRERERIDGEVERLEQLQSLGEADLDAPTGRLREPVDAYNRVVREAFRAFKREQSAREVLAFVADTGTYPLVAFRQPPEDLFAYVRESEVGTEPISTLLEYSEYSRSKLGHYVDDAADLKRHVATERTYLERLDAGPLTVDWPPPRAERLRYEARERVAVTARFAPESVVERAREVRDLAHDPEYERLREAVVAEEQLTAEQRRRLDDGGIADDLAALRDRHETLSAALEEYPER